MSSRVNERRTAGGRRPFRLTERELRAHVTIFAGVLWALALFNTWTPGPLLRSGQVKGTDFVHFYAFGSLVATSDADDLYDHDALMARQGALVPAAAGAIYPPVNAPQIAVLFAPLAMLSYYPALLLWTGLTVIAYLTVVTVVARQTASTAAHTGTVGLAAVAFPPFWQLVQHGQLSVLGSVAIFLGWLGLRTRHPWFSGLCLGILAYKPPLFTPVAAVLLLAGEWRMFAGMAVSGLAQLLAAGVWVGSGVLLTYVDVLLALPRAAEMMAAKPAQMHSLRTFWELLVPWRPGAIALYATTALAAVGSAAWLWRRSASANLRMAALSLATVLAAPHLYVYDLVLLAPAFIWLVDGFLRQSRDARIGRLLYVAYLAPLAAPFVPSIRVQVSTLCIASLLWLLVREQDAGSASDHHGVTSATGNS
jgi:alpha-1,2-mannosyltransferase